jgi:hypothetical protein
MAQLDQHEKNIEYLAWAIQYHAQIHKGITGTPWTWSPSPQEVLAPVSVPMGQLDKISEIQSCVRSLMACNKDDLLSGQNDSDILSEEQKHEFINQHCNEIKHVEGVSENDTQKMLQTTMLIINQAFELSQTGNRMGSAKFVMTGYKACLEEIFQTGRFATESIQPVTKPELNLIG